MNESWLLAWQDTIHTMNEMGEMYVFIMSTIESVTEDSTPEQAGLWLSRNIYLTVQLDLIRDMLWHDMRGKTNCLEDMHGVV